MNSFECNVYNAEVGIQTNQQLLQQTYYIHHKDVYLYFIQ